MYEDSSNIKLETDKKGFLFLFFCCLNYLSLQIINIKAMKQLFIICIALLSLFPIRMEARKYYCEIKGIQKELSSGLKIVFDFGESQVYSIWGGLKNKQKLVDENGKDIEFNSMVDAANYMSEKGWNFQHAYTSFYSGNAIHHWILYKESETKEEAGEGIMTKETYRENKR